MHRCEVLLRIGYFLRLRICELILVQCDVGCRGVMRPGSVQLLGFDIFIEHSECFVDLFSQFIVIINPDRVSHPYRK